MKRNVIEARYFNFNRKLYHKKLTHKYMELELRR